MKIEPFFRFSHSSTSHKLECKQFDFHTVKIYLKESSKKSDCYLGIETGLNSNRPL